MKNFADILEDHKGIGPGFDFLRIFLALGVAAYHATQLRTADNLVHLSGVWFAEYALVPMFFTLSGFLITASGIRLTLKNFIINRSLRIVPALAIDVCLCALVIGPIFTIMSLHDYYRSSGFFAYFLNILGYVHYTLPGVFEDHVVTYVNGSLWTIPYEILCYVLISFFILLSWLKGKWPVLLFTIGLLSLGVFFQLTNLHEHLPSLLFRAIRGGLLSRKCQVVTAFLFGIIAYQWRDKIPYSKAVFISCLVICLGAAATFDYTITFGAAAARIVLLPAIAYMTIFTGLTKIQLPAFLRHGDYSYGIYLYHFPILQTWLSVFTPAFPQTLYGAALLYCMALPCITLFAMLSWHYIERPILKLRKNFSFIARERELTQALTKASMQSGSL